MLKQKSWVTQLYPYSGGVCQQLDALSSFLYKENLKFVDVPQDCVRTVRVYRDRKRTDHVTRRDKTEVPVNSRVSMVVVEVWCSGRADSSRPGDGTAPRPQRSRTVVRR